jgi:hypothetical protein
MLAAHHPPIPVGGVKGDVLFDLGQQLGLGLRRGRPRRGGAAIILVAASCDSFAILVVAVAAEPA